MTPDFLSLNYCWNILSRSLSPFGNSNDFRNFETNTSYGCTLRLHYMDKSTGPNDLIFEFRHFQTHSHWCIKKRIIKHLAIQSTFANICERKGSCQEINRLERDSVMGCHHRNKSVCKTSSLLVITQSTVCGRIPKAMNCQIVQKIQNEVCQVCKNCPCSVRLNNSFAINIGKKSVHRDLHAMAFYG